MWKSPCWPGNLPSSDRNQSMSSSSVTWKPPGAIAASLAASSAAKAITYGYWLREYVWKVNVWGRYSAMPRGC